MVKGRDAQKTLKEKRKENKEKKCKKAIGGPYLFNLKPGVVGGH